MVARSRSLNPLVSTIFARLAKPDSLIMSWNTTVPVSPFLIDDSGYAGRRDEQSESGQVADHHVVPVIHHLA